MVREVRIDRRLRFHARNVTARAVARVDPRALYEDLPLNPIRPPLTDLRAARCALAFVESSSVRLSTWLSRHIWRSLGLAKAAHTENCTCPRGLRVNRTGRF